MFYHFSPSSNAEVAFYCVIVGFLGSSYLVGGDFPNIKDDNIHPTLTILGSLSFLPSFVKHISLTVLA